jgi:hypothetical protein
MKFSRFAVHHPILTVMATLIVIILGAVSVTRLPIDLMPDITYPVLSVSTEYGDASPEEIEELITRPLEEAMSAVPGVEEITSVSMEGRSRVRLSFTWGTDLDAAAFATDWTASFPASLMMRSGPGSASLTLQAFRSLFLGSPATSGPYSYEKSLKTRSSTVSSASPVSLRWMCVAAVTERFM